MPKRLYPEESDLEILTAEEARSRFGWSSLRLPQISIGNYLGRAALVLLLSAFALASGVAVTQASQAPKDPKASSAPLRPGRSPKKPCPDVKMYDNIDCKAWNQVVGHISVAYTTSTGDTIETDLFEIPRLDHTPQVPYDGWIDFEVSTTFSKDAKALEPFMEPPEVYVQVDDSTYVLVGPDASPKDLGLEPGNSYPLLIDARDICDRLGWSVIGEINVTPPLDYERTVETGVDVIDDDRQPPLVVVYVGGSPWSKESSEFQLSTASHEIQKSTRGDPGDVWQVGVELAYPTWSIAAAYEWLRMDGEAWRTTDGTTLQDHLLRTTSELEAVKFFPTKAGLSVVAEGYGGFRWTGTEVGDAEVSTTEYTGWVAGGAGFGGLDKDFIFVTVGPKYAERGNASDKDKRLGIVTHLSGRVGDRWQGEVDVQYQLVAADRPGESRSTRQGWGVELKGTRHLFTVAGTDFNVYVSGDYDDIYDNTQGTQFDAVETSMNAVVWGGVSVKWF